MNNSCDYKIAVNVVYNGCNPATKGLKPIGWLANFEDIDHTAMNAVSNLKSTTQRNLFKDIKLKEGTHLVQIYQSGKSPFSGAKKEAATGTFRNTTNKTLPFVVLDNGAEVTQYIIDKLMNGKFVAIVENAFSGHSGDNAFEIIGLETGLTLTECTDEKYNEDFGGGWSITMMEENAPHSGLFILVEPQVQGASAVDATRALLDSYLVPVATITGDTEVEVPATATPVRRTYATSTGQGVSAYTGADWLTVSASGNKVTFTPTAYPQGEIGTRRAYVYIGLADSDEGILEVLVTQAGGE